MYTYDIDNIDVDENLGLMKAQKSQLINEIVCWYDAQHIIKN